MIMKYLKVFIIYSLLIINILPCYADDSLYELYNIKYNYKILSEKVNMEPITLYCEDSYTLLNPTKKNRKEAQKIQSDINKSKGTIIFSDDDYNDFFSAMSIIQSDCSPYKDIKIKIKESNDKIYYVLNKKDYKNAVNISNKRERQINNIIKKCNIKKGMEKGEAILRVSEYMRNNFHYDYKRSKNNDTLYDYILLKTNKGVCVDYAELFQKIMLKIGIYCTCIIDKDYDHMFNSVLINNKEYFIDTCWNDQQEYSIYTLSPYKIFFDHKCHRIGDYIFD